MNNGFWKQNNNDLRSNIQGGFPAFGGQNMMNRGFNNQNAAALGLLKGMNQVGQRNAMDPYGSMNSQMVDNFRGSYRMDGGGQFNAFYMQHDRLPQANMAAQFVAERTIYGSQMHQTNQFNAQNQMGRKRGNNWGNQGNFQGNNQRNKKNKNNQNLTPVSTPTKVKSVTQMDTSNFQESEVIPLLNCSVCDMSNFSSTSEFKNHMTEKVHLEALTLAKERNTANIDYLRSEAHLAAKRHIIESKRKGIQINKLLNCSICRCEYYGTYATHKLNFEHEQLFRFENTKCCGRNFGNRDKLLDHELTLEHFQVLSKNPENMDEDFTNISGKIEDFAENKIYEIGMNTLTPYQPNKAIALQALTAHDGYTCDICPANDSIELTFDDIKKHCASLPHYEEILKILSSKSNKSEESIKKEIKNKMMYANNDLSEISFAEHTMEDELDATSGKKSINIGDIDEDALDFEYI